MVEENKGKVVDKEKLAELEKKLAEEQAEELKKINEAKAKEIEERVKKELEAEAKEKELAERLNKIEEENKRVREEAEKKLKEQEEKLKVQEEIFKKKLEEVLATKKGVVNNNSPFKNEEGNNDNIKMVGGVPVDVSKLDAKEVERLSAAEFRKYFNLPNFFFEKS